MPTRVVVGLHVAWMAVFVGLALWAGWLFRFEGDSGLLYLDRWRGELVDAVGDTHYRYSLRQPVEYRLPVQVETAPKLTAVDYDPFADLPATPQENVTPAGPTNAPTRGFHPLAPDPAPAQGFTPLAPDPKEAAPAGAFDDLIPKRGEP